ncbi:chondroitin proteoglycan 2-like [Betta splendens]|uniref:chitinase n=1 Tax=Betta splendens TaxID=158456 RepID=A0A6P7NWL6_BETSP|nr:chondroitin proteoglycan 2-like [Betta splendens]
MCRLILTAGACLIIANLASSASLTDTVLTTKAPSATDNFCEGKTDGNYANPSNPNSFYGCSNGLTNILWCPEDLVFKQSCNCCDWPRTRSDGLARDFCKGKKNGNYFNPSNINSFYSCSNGLTYIMKCPEDLIFNQRLNACVWP